MDPDATLKLLLDALDDGDHDAAHEHATNLGEWFGRGGFPALGHKRDGTASDYRAIMGARMIEWLLAFVAECCTKDDTEIIITTDGVEITYATVELAIEATDSDPYEMQLTGDGAKAVEQAANQGIDSRLQACNIHGKDSYEWKDISDNPRLMNTKLCCSVSPRSLCVLIRRLFESDDDEATCLAGDILQTLGIDDAGKYVGREAVGLE